MRAFSSQSEQDAYWMQKALRLARCAAAMGEIPVGALLIYNNRLISVGYNLSISDHDPSAHAEMVAIRRAGKKMQNYRLVDTVLYVTLEPCPMCAGALVHSRIKRLVYGASDPKTGAAGSVMNLCEHVKLNHKVEVVAGIEEAQCSAMLSAFFKQRRNEKKQLKQSTNRL